MAELKPCPFCGGKADIIHYNTGHWLIACEEEDCCLWYGKLFHTKENAINAWNTRTPIERGEVDG